MITVDRLIRAGGWFLAAGGTLAAAAALGRDHVDATTVNPGLTAVGTAGVVGGLLLLTGLPAWYAVQAGRAGRLGAAAFLLTFIGWAGVQVGTEPLYTYVAPAIYSRPGNADLAAEGALDTITTGFGAYVITLLLALNLGLLLFGVSMIRARVFPRALGWAVALGPVAVLFLSTVEQGAIAILLLAIAVGGALMATGRVRLTTPEPVVAVTTG